MIIAAQKRKENIAEYLIYMYQVEDMIRASGFDPIRIDQTIISQFDTDYNTKREMLEWYKDLISRMKNEGKENSGHMDFLDRIAGRMNDLNVAGIFVTNSRVHLVARYLAERGFMRIRLIGYDLLPESIEYLKREYIDFLISQSPEEQAYIGLRQLFTRVVLRKSTPHEVILPIDILTKENIEPYLKFNKQYEQPE